MRFHSTFRGFIGFNGTVPLLILSLAIAGASPPAAAQGLVEFDDDLEAVAFRCCILTGAVPSEAHSCRLSPKVATSQPIQPATSCKGGTLTAPVNFFLFQPCQL
jgi:hypothetical protein